MSSKIKSDLYRDIKKLIVCQRNEDSTIYRITVHTTIHFQLAPELYGQHVEFYCNYPQTAAFNRHNYHKFKWYSNDEGTNIVSISLKLPGSYRYYISLHSKKEDKDEIGSGYFLVDPELHFTDNDALPLDSIQSQTVLSKLLGNFETWEKKLLISKKCHYNMIHFTPIQELGESNSGYSIKNQLKLNPIFGDEVTYEKVAYMLQRMRQEWKVLSICDIVLNHTANETPWLLDQPEASYNCWNCPYLRPAFLLDTALARFSLAVARGDFEHLNIPPTVHTYDHLEAIRHVLSSKIIPDLRLHEMYMCDVVKCVAQFSSAARLTNACEADADDSCKTDDVLLIQDSQFRRFGGTIDINKALVMYNVYRKGCFDEESRLKLCISTLKQHLDLLNSTATTALTSSLTAAVDNCLAHIRYERVQSDGPRLGAVTAQSALLTQYFTNTAAADSTADFEVMAYGEDGVRFMAHNGWLMNAKNPMDNFALDERVYIRRELIVWGDSVKLRYGSSEADSPFLWRHMRSYVEQTAAMFAGFRLDNCHSTPLHVAEMMVDAARAVNPNLYVLAELFTNSPQTDALFVNRLGITSLVRESLSAWDSHELGRLVHRYGGAAMGSFPATPTCALRPSLPHALLLDQSHDNESVLERRGLCDVMANCALVSMAACAIGSTRGYDELVPHQINVVTESRDYAEWWEDGTNGHKDGRVNADTGIMAVRRQLNRLHRYLGDNNFTQVFVDQVDADIVAVTRHNPMTHESVVMVAFTAFERNKNNNSCSSKEYIKPLVLDGYVRSVLLEAGCDVEEESLFPFVSNDTYINGLTNFSVSMRCDVEPEEARMIECTSDSNNLHSILHLQLAHFRPGSVVVVKVAPSAATMSTLATLTAAIESSEVSDALRSLTLLDLNLVLFRCDAEEHDMSNGNTEGVYDIPGYGRLVYCGLQGFVSLLENVQRCNDLGHPMCQNLREGPWMMEYVWKRLEMHSQLRALSHWLQRTLTAVATLPRYLVSANFGRVLMHAHSTCMQHCLSLMPEIVSFGKERTFYQLLALTSVQLVGAVPSAPLPPFTHTDTVYHGSLSAGLPHFSTGYCRNWGRDTFIALRGLLMLTGRFEDARRHILSYATALDHGLIPNLLDAGRKPRYNCRDAVWWWLHCIQSYTRLAPDGHNLLDTHILLLLQEPPQAQNTTKPLYSLIQEALTVHFQGIVFRERDAGATIDAHMTDGGFTVQIGVHPDTGFVFGGNGRNCGTWMDKMGSSQRAGNAGRPATPRDGSAVELVALQYSTLRWLQEASLDGKYPHDSVSRHCTDNDTTISWTWQYWADKISTHFERNFWIDPNHSDPLVNHSSIYKDTCGATHPWADFQLRCNYPVAMVIAPELFTRARAQRALEMARVHLIGPLGIKTLDRSDWNYRPNYDNQDDGEDATTAHGFNYHNGPEWLWPVGFYLRARLAFCDESDRQQEVASVVRMMAAHLTHLRSSPWRGLPELTNAEGADCRDTCHTQAWSSATLIEVLYDLAKMDSTETYGKSNIST